MRYCGPSRRGRGVAVGIGTSPVQPPASANSTITTGSASPRAHWPATLAAQRPITTRSDQLLLLWFRHQAQCIKCWPRRAIFLDDAEEYVIVDGWITALGTIVEVEQKPHLHQARVTHPIKGFHQVFTLLLLTYVLGEAEVGRELAIHR